MIRCLPGKDIPHCRLLAQLVDLSRRGPLQHTAHLKGAKEPNTFITITKGKPNSSCVSVLYAS